MRAPLRRPALRHRLLAALVLAAVMAQAPAPAAAPQARRPHATTQRVLFIGNSFSFFNNISDVVAGIADSLADGPAVDATLFADGGMTLQWHLASGKAFAAIDGSRWDRVVLQEQSALGGGSEDGESKLSPPGIFHESVRRFVPHIRAHGSAPLLLMTWARQRHPEEQPILADAYLTIARELSVPVAPAGLAWQEARRRWPDLVLHVADGSHPNPTGTYLSACVLYATLTGRSPRGAASTIIGHPWSRRLQAVDMDTTATLVDLNPALARRLQDLAWEVTSRTPDARR